MGNGLLSFILGAAVTAWVYNKMYGRTGGNAKNAAIIAGVAGVFSGLILMILLKALFGDAEF